MAKKVILTGIRANNDLHIGNYFGALLPIVDMAKAKSEEYQVNLFMPDLHSFTTPIDHNKLQSSIMNSLRVFVAAGLPLENPNVHIYRQSYVAAHSELTLLLNNFTGVGEMERMIQYKEKSTKLGKDRVSLGLLDYPVLQAADILLYGASYIPVGDDQTQHLEFTRDIAERMNAKFGNLFTVPVSVKEQHEFFGKDQGLRIKDLADPTKKMSKSDETGKGVIFLNDSPEDARKKIMSAETDSFGKIAHDRERQPGISNLLELLELFGGNAQDFIGSASYGELKTAAADKVVEFLIDFQARLSQVNENQLRAKLASSEAAMNSQAGEVLAAVQKAVGLR
jgi:tryptophanyl-tRNA synthetase